MTLKWIVIAVAAVSVLVAEPALARAKHQGKNYNKHHTKYLAKRLCDDRPLRFSWNFLWLGGPAPQPNGCAPPVYHGAEFVGQDPDLNIRYQLRRDPDTGYYQRY